MKDKKIKSALISVYHKDGLDAIILRLAELGVRIYSTGGTFDFIKGLGVEAEAVETLTSYPSILGGRVKTLHPRIFGGILGRRDNQSDMEQMKQYQIPEVDLVIVDLYPFSETVRSGALQQEIIEKIDIGGISLIRAGAKNFNDVLVVAGSFLYDRLHEILNARRGFSSIEERKYFAAEAFRVSSGYDADIFNYFNRTEGIDALRLSHDTKVPLRYGENPHQKALYYGNLNDTFEQHHGKDISYNNLLDIDSALSYVSLFQGPTVVIVKHNNACGLASAESLKEAWTRALAGDPVSAYGGIIATNGAIDKETADEINKIFFEVIIAPSYNKGVTEILSQKKNRIILTIKKMPSSTDTMRSVLDGVLWQERDRFEVKGTEQHCVTERNPSDEEMADLSFANKIVMHTKSNAIVLVKNQQLIGFGAGQTSRVDAVRQAISKAEAFGFDTAGAVLASDAYFPFSDNISVAAAAGIRAIVQPGGSVRDQESVDECNKNGIAMIFTGLRHFKH
ncbi:MAG: bifunctional phosphoribosylaminoimidazolecarboxamide formyltransferase/IMP cyclohydrolase [Bacteroidales bacterium]|nr:bifunctional phosphoribosylaminoimidazolecarboxamide formyltransferase/IMP cyclohydrolase [Bacteroidales bacterium]